MLGCAGMTGLHRRISAALSVPVVDGVAAAVRLAESLVALGLTTSRAGSYAEPRPKARGWRPGPVAPAAIGGRERSDPTPLPHT